jgi:hypothetical protein
MKSMYYHFAILLLFRPLIKLRILGSSLLPRDVCSQAADAIQGLVRSYAQLYTLRRTPSFVPYFVLTSSIMHLAISAVGPIGSITPPTQASGEQPESKLDPKVADAIKQGIADLAEMAPCHGFAEQALNILQYLARKWDLEVEVSAGKSAQDEPLRIRASTTSLNFFVPNLQEQDFMCTWTSTTDTAIRTTTVASDHTPGPSSSSPTESTDNPLFWPFPMQGRPMLPTGRALEEAGFTLL